MTILLDHKEIGSLSNTKEKMNVLGCSEVTEVHDNILLLKTKDNSFLKERVGTWMNKPVVKFNVLAENVLHRDVLFMIGENAESAVNFESLGIALKPKSAAILTESNANYDITPQLVTEQAKEVITSTVNRGKAYLKNVLKEEHQKIASNTTNEVKRSLEKIAGNIIGELEIVKEEIFQDIVDKNSIVFERKLQEITTIEQDLENSLKESAREYVNTLISEKRDSLDVTVKQLCDKYAQALFEEVDTNEVITDLYEQFSEPVIKQNLAKIQESVTSLVDETTLKSKLFTEVKAEAVKAAAGVIEEARKSTKAVDKLFNDYRQGFTKDLDNIRQRISRVAESGGGTNAVQYANGGTMDGNLTVTGVLSGHVPLNCLDQEGATVNQVIGWNGLQWSPMTTIQRYTLLIGDGVADNFTITHNLNTLDAMVSVFDDTTNEVVYASIQNIDVNNTKVSFSNVPGINNYRVAIIG